MKFSEAWLREWVNPGLERDALLEQLTMAGLEVDGFEPVASEFSGVVVARVDAVQAHPDADKLSVCVVNDGETTHQVVCGAPNVRAGLITAFARVGAVLPDNFKIKKAKLRGVESGGMLCSGAELGINDDADGIIELDDDLRVGADLRAALTLDDVTVDLDLTPNRGDCLSLKGIAREVGVLNNVPVNFPVIDSVPPASERTFAVNIEDGEGCPRYLGRVIEGVDLSQGTPVWMQERLRRCGLRSIDAVVDITNYVLLELGQPMHAFDLDVLKDGITVRRAVPGETLELLDGQVVELDQDTLLIVDGAGPVAIAGVMGGARSGVQADTQNVFLECAFFAPLAVAGTARRYGLHTDASHRYERGVDYELQAEALERATGLLLEIVGGTPGPIVDTEVVECVPTAASVSLRATRLNQLLGVTIDASQVDDALARLGFAVGSQGDASEGVTWNVIAPSHRFDIAIEADLVEEVCRIYGYNNVPSRRPVASIALRNVPLDRQPEVMLKQQLVVGGYQEVITYSFVDPRLQDLFDPGAEPLALANPMSGEQSVMRTNLLPGLVSVVQQNAARQQSRVRVFELGACFLAGNTGTDSGSLEQRQVLGGALWGQRHGLSWHGRAENVDFFDVKGDVERLLAASGQSAVRFLAPAAALAQGSGEAADLAVFHPGQSAVMIAADRRVGRLGCLHPEIQAQLGLPTAVYVFEIDAEFVLAHLPRQHHIVSRHPSVRRDLALVVAQKVSAAEIETLVRDAVGELLIDFRVFDVYQGEGIDSNEKSVAIGLTFQHPSATLTDAQVSDLTDRAVTLLSNHVDARLR